MWFILRPLIFYLESLVFRYIPLARGDVWKKRGGRSWEGACILSYSTNYATKLPCELGIVVYFKITLQLLLPSIHDINSWTNTEVSIWTVPIEFQ